MFILSILAAMIASRSMILATFSVINMALALDCFPRVTVIHTSRRFMGQMYIPTINWFMAIMCVFIIAGFKSTDFIAHAFGKEMFFLPIQKYMDQSFIFSVKLHAVSYIRSFSMNKSQIDAWKKVFSM